MKAVKTFFLQTYSPLVMLLLWEWLARANRVDARFFPPPSVIIRDIAGLAAHGVLLPDILASLFRIGGGLLLGGVPALILGILMARSKSLYYFMHPLISLAYPVPKIAIIPLVIVLLGLGELSKITVVGLGAFFLILLNTYHGVSNIDRVYFDIARIYNYATRDVWRYIILRGALPAIMNGIKLAVGVAFILVVAAEFIGSSSGIGYRIWVSWETFQIVHMYAGLFVLSALGWTASLLLSRLECLLMPWRTSKDMHE